MPELENFSITNYLNSPLWSNLLFKRVSDNPVSDLETDLPRWRNSSRFLFESSSICRGAIQNFSQITVGKGLFCEPDLTYISADIETKQKLKNALKNYFCTWSNSCHINGADDLASICRAIVGAICRDGDVLVYLTTNRKRDSIKLDLISSERISTPDKSEKDFSNLKSSCFLGVQTTNREIDGYWVKSANRSSFFKCFDSAGRLKSVLLRNPYNVERLNSYRGTPILSSCLDSIEQLQKLLESELQANILKSKQIAVWKSESVSEAGKSASGIKAQKLGETNLLVIPSSDSFELTKGNEISNPNISQIVKIYYQLISFAFSVPYDVIFCLLDDSSYSVNQAIRQAAWESTEIWRDYLSKNLLIPLYKIVIEFALSNNFIPEISDLVKDFEIADLLNVKFSGKPNFSIKSKDYSEANSTALQNGEKSISDICAENGSDALQVLNSQLEYIAAKKRKMQQLGLSQEDLKTYGN